MEYSLVFVDGIHGKIIQKEIFFNADEGAKAHLMEVVKANGYTFGEVQLSTGESFIAHKTHKNIDY